VTAEEVWRDEGRGLLLLRISASLPSDAARFGRLEGELPVPVSALGFPDATLESGASDTLFVLGDCSPQTGILYGRMRVRVSSLAPQNREDWRGLSGAAVFAGGYLVGVLSDVAGPFADVLEAVTIAPSLTDPRLLKSLSEASVHPGVQPVDADMARPFGAAGFDALCARYSDALITSFRLDGSGLAVKGATGHALSLARAYSGTNYELNNERLSLADLAAKSRRLVVLGTPGSGKSVTLKLLLSELVKRQGLVPVYLRLTEFSNDQSARAELTSAQFLDAFARLAEQSGVPGVDACDGPGCLDGFRGRIS
jgi:hypothetical protein